jgi:branched-chain amino acid transport system substrate-binding protein
MPSSNMVQLRDDFKKLKIPTIATIATNNSVIKENGYVAQVCMSNHTQSLVAAHYIRDEKLKQHVGVLFDANNTYSEELAKGFKEVFKTIEGKVDFFINLNDTNSTIQLQELPLENIEMLYCTANAVLTANAIKVIKKKNPNIQILGGDGLLSDAIENTKKDLYLFDGVYVIDHYAHDIYKNNRRKQFEKLLKEEQFKESTYAFLAYDGYLLLVEALNTCKNYDTVCINAMLQNSNTIQGIAGNFSMVNAKSKREIYVNKIENSALKKEVVVY